MNKKPSSGFKAYDQCRVAVMVTTANGPIEILGVAMFERDAQLGNVLRIRCEMTETSESFDLLISESPWDGEIRPGDGQTCDYRFYLQPRD